MWLKDGRLQCPLHPVAISECSPHGTSYQVMLQKISHSTEYLSNYYLRVEFIWPQLFAKPTVCVMHYCNDLQVRPSGVHWTPYKVITDLMLRLDMWVWDASACASPTSASFAEPSAANRMLLLCNKLAISRPSFRLFACACVILWTAPIIWM